jgi:hypothetical protein
MTVGVKFLNALIILYRSRITSACPYPEADSPSVSGVITVFVSISPDHNLIKNLTDEYGPSHLVKYSSDYSHIIHINETTYLANPFSAIQTMTYASGSNKDRARIKMILK